MNRKIYLKNWREKNKERLKKYNKNWREENGEWLKNYESSRKPRKRYNSEKEREWRKNVGKYNLSYKYSEYKNRAKRKNISFLLTKEEFDSFKSMQCHYCGDTIDGYGLDRIDNNEGYYMNNTVPCCSICNKMKLTMGLKEFIERCNKIVNNKAI